MVIAALAFVATLAFEIPFAKLEAMMIKGNYNIRYLHFNLMKKNKKTSTFP